MELKDTIEMMSSEDYKERFKAEYYQTKIRYEKLKKFNVTVEAANALRANGGSIKVFNHDVPKLNCPAEILQMQQRMMGEYLHTLEIRAVIDDIEL